MPGLGLESERSHEVHKINCPGLLRGAFGWRVKGSRAMGGGCARGGPFWASVMGQLSRLEVNPPPPQPSPMGRVGKVAAS